MLVMGVTATLYAVRHDLMPDFFPRPIFLMMNLIGIFVFAGLVAAGIAFRHRAEWHKRLMLLATMALLTPAVARIDAITFRPLGVPPLVLPMMVTAAFLAWAWVRDWRQRGHIHPALLYGGILLLVTMPLRRWIGFTDGWRPIAEQLVAWMT
jgi:hypothetical protein